MYLSKQEAALELLKFKAQSQMCKGKTTCTLTETDIREVLFIAGMQLEKELEVIM